MARMALENVSDPDAEVTQALAFLRQTFPNLDPDDPDPLIDLPAIAELAGVSKGTPMIWRQRSKPDYDGPGRMDGPAGAQATLPATRRRAVRGQAAVARDRHGPALAVCDEEVATWDGGPPGDPGQQGGRLNNIVGTGCIRSPRPTHPHRRRPQLT
jgi:hypothetical protein